MSGTLLLINVLILALNCIVQSSQSSVLKKPGDVILGGFVDVVRHDGTIDPIQIQRVEAMVHAVDAINRNPYYLPHTSLGLQIADVCEYGRCAAGQEDVKGK